MTRTGRVPLPRLFKAIELEDCLVDLGHRVPVLTEEMKAAALVEISRRRGQPTDASADTWTLVSTFLADRYGPDSAATQAAAATVG